MSDDSLAIARFNHVSTSGNLVFTVDDMSFMIPVDDTLERAILEAKQLKAEQNTVRTTTQSLPISQIQSLIRAGADPTQVASSYNLNEALVRRFSASVEAEKQYAIEQFLRVPAPRDSRVRTISEIIERTLAAARVPRESVQWKATRRGLEPWRISASFTCDNHRITAQWSWDMHSNSVVCINTAASKLLGETKNNSVHVSDGLNEDVADGFPATYELPGDSARSARIELTVSSWEKAHQQEKTVAKQLESSTTEQQQDPAPNPQLPQAPEEKATSEVPTSDQPASEQTNNEVKPQHPKKKGRSAVPSWDEILFGE